MLTQLSWQSCSNSIGWLNETSVTLQRYAADPEDNRREILIPLS